jgi:hypothetical protein
MKDEALSKDEWDELEMNIHALYVTVSHRSPSGGAADNARGQLVKINEVLNGQLKGWEEWWETDGSEIEVEDGVSIGHIIYRVAKIAWLNAYFKAHSKHGEVLNYVLQTLKHHHTTKPGIKEIINFAESKIKEGEE